MIAADFDYARPLSLGEALGLLNRPGAIAIAGGQSLLPLHAERSIAADLLVDIGSLTEFRSIALEGDQLVIGAGATLAAIMAAGAMRSAPLLQDAIRSVGSEAIRNRGTLVGNLVRASPNSELPVAVAALEARFIVRHQRGERELTASDFFLGPHRTALSRGELVTELRISLATRRAGGFAEIAARAGAPPLCCVAVTLDVDKGAVVTMARVIAGGVTGVPARWTEAEAAIVGHPLSDVVAQLAGCPEPNLIATLDLPESAYARDVLPVLARRALMAASARLATATSSEHLP